MDKSWAKCAFYLMFIATISLGTSVIFLDLLPFPHEILTIRIGCFLALFLLLISLSGIWVPDANLFHYQISKFLAYSSIIIFLLTLCHSMAIDFIHELKDSKIHQLRGTNIITTSSQIKGEIE